MADETTPDRKLQVNLKTPSGTLINAYASSEAEMGFLLKDLQKLAPDIAQTEALLSGTQTAAVHLGATPVSQETFAPATQGPPPAFAQPAAQQQYAPQQQAPAGFSHPRDRVGRGGNPRPQQPAPTCSHGERFWNSFQAKSGKTMSQWLCPLDSGDYKNPAPGQCQAEWAN